MREVAFLRDAALPPAPGLTTLVLPLLEQDARRCPRGDVGLHPSAAAIEALDSKSEFVTYMARLGLARHCPETWLDAAAVRFPCAVKRCDLSAGAGIGVAHDAAGLAAMLAQPPWQGRAVMLQEWVPGHTERTLHCLCRSGRILWQVSLEFRMDPAAPVRTPGNVRRTRAVPTAAAHLEVFEAILRPLGYDGVCNFDFKLAPDGGLWILEANPRIGGSLLRDYCLRHRVAMLQCLIETAVLGAPRRWSRARLG